MKPVLQEKVPYHDPVFKPAPKPIEILNLPTAMRPITKETEIDPMNINLPDKDIDEDLEENSHIKQIL